MCRTGLTYATFRTSLKERTLALREVRASDVPVCAGISFWAMDLLRTMWIFFFTYDSLCGFMFFVGIVDRFLYDLRMHIPGPRHECINFRTKTHLQILSAIKLLTGDSNGLSMSTAFSIVRCWRVIQSKDELSIDEQTLKKTSDVHKRPPCDVKRPLHCIRNHACYTMDISHDRSCCNATMIEDW